MWRVLSLALSPDEAYQEQNRHSALSERPLLTGTRKVVLFPEYYILPICTHLALDSETESYCRYFVPRLCPKLSRG